MLKIVWFDDIPLFRDIFRPSMYVIVHYISYQLKYEEGSID